MAKDKDDGWLDHNRAAIAFAILLKEWNTITDELKQELVFDINATLRDQEKDLQVCGCGYHECRR